MSLYPCDTLPNPGDECEDVECVSCIQCIELIPVWLFKQNHGLCINCDTQKHALTKKPAKEPRCRAKTRYGTLCHKRSIAGCSYCHIHTVSNNTEYRMCATCYTAGIIKTTGLVTFFHYSGSDINLCNKHFVDMCEASWPK